MHGIIPTRSRDVDKLRTVTPQGRHRSYEQNWDAFWRKNSDAFHVWDESQLLPLWRERARKGTWPYSVDHDTDQAADRTGTKSGDRHLREI